MNLYVTSLMKHRAQKSILFTAAEHINAYVLQLYVILTLFFFTEGRYYYPKNSSDF